MKMNCLRNVLGLIVVISLLVFPSSAVSKVTIEFPSWYFGYGPFVPWLKNAITAFQNAHPDIEINGYNVPFFPYFDKMYTRIGAGNPPDLIHLSGGYYTQFAYAGFLMPLTDRIAKSGFKDAYAPIQFKPPIVVGNEIYMVNHLLATYVPIYNKKLYEKNGIKIPTTPGEFLAVSKSLTQDTDGDKQIDTFGFAITLSPEANWAFFREIAYWAIGFGGHVSDDGKPTMTSKPVIEALKVIKALYDDNITPKGINNATYRKMYAQGKVATIIDGPWVNGLAAKENPASKEFFATYPLPFPTNRAPAGVEGICIPKNAKNKEEAWKFIEFLSSKQWQKAMLEIAKMPTARLDAYSDEFMSENPWFKTYLDTMTKRDLVIFDPPGIYKDYMRAIEIIGDGVRKMLANGQPVEAAAEEIQTHLTKMLSGAK